MVFSPTAHRCAALLTYAAVVCLCAAGSARAQERSTTPVAIPRLTGPVVLDGMSDEPAWLAVPVLPAGQNTPNAGQRPSERTEFRLAYDDHFLYASGRMYDASPDGIRATSLRRDDGAFSNDWFAVNIDTYNDKETMLVFGANPAGVRTDAVFATDGQGNGNFSYNAFWDAAVHQTREGWFAEIRIPLSSLRFEERDGHVLMGVTLWRRIARKNEMDSYPTLASRWGTLGVVKASQAQEMTLEGVHRRRPAYFTPYLLGGDATNSVLATGGLSYVRKGDSPRELGADLKVGVASDLTLDMTYNTDFAQVEADDQQINLTRFSLFFPEKRPFFQERSGLFDFSLGPTDQMFYSRRIGLAGGEPVPLYGGARLVGRLAGWDIGVLNMQTEAVASRSLPTANFGVLRARHQLLNPNSYVGTLITTRFDSGSRNVLAAFDAILRLRARDYLTMQAGHVTDDDTTTGSASLERVMLRAFYERRGSDGLGFGFGASRLGARFIPALGYLQRTNFTRAGGRLFYGWRQGADSKVQRYTLSMDGFALRRNTDGEVETVNAGPQWAMEMKSGRMFTVGAPIAYENLLAPFTVATGATIPAGTYRYQRLTASVAAPSSDLRRVDLSAGIGPFYDGGDRTISVTPTWIASRHLELSGLYQVDRIDLPIRNQHVTAQVARVRARTSFTSSTSFAAFVQYNSLSDQVITNARLRFNPREGTDLYVVYNDARNTQPGAYTPVRNALDGRTLLIKFARTVNAEF